LALLPWACATVSDGFQFFLALNDALKILARHLSKGDGLFLSCVPDAKPMQDKTIRRYSIDSCSRTFYIGYRPISLYFFGQNGSYRPSLH
jgi:hypothetical protein